MSIAMIDAAPRIGEEELNKLESRFGFVFPEDVRQHYLLFNGGRPVPNLFAKEDEYFAVSEFLPIAHGTPGTRFEDTYFDLVEGNDFFPKNLIPIASDSAGDYFCSDMGPENKGAIFFYQSDYYDDPSRAVVFLARNLKEFMSSLVSDVE